MTQTVGFFRNAFDAMIAARTLKAERQVAKFLETHGHDAVAYGRSQKVN